MKSFRSLQSTEVGGSSREVRGSGSGAREELKGTAVVGWIVANTSERLWVNLVTYVNDKNKAM